MLKLRNFLILLISDNTALDKMANITIIFSNIIEKFVILEKVL